MRQGTHQEVAIVSNNLMPPSEILPMTKILPLVRQFGFSARRRRALLELVGLDSSDHAHARSLQKRVIGPHAQEIIDEFYRCLKKNPQARKILGQGFNVAHLRATQLTYLRTLGVGFDQAAYFEGRLRVGVAHARVSVPLSLYQATYALLQRLILVHLGAEAVKHPRRYRALAAYLTKIAALDMSLAIETYHDLRLGALQKSLSNLRGEALALHRRAHTDSSTGLINHGRILSLLKQELAKTAERPVSVIIADVDNFKSINDTHGHLTGDKVLLGITGRLRSSARHGDIIGRYGGDEFMLILKSTSPRTALRIAERIRTRIADEPFDLGNFSTRVTLSAGVATAHAAETSEGLIARADAALYRAKAMGRNCVLTAAPASVKSRRRLVTTLAEARAAIR